MTSNASAATVAQLKQRLIKACAIANILKVAETTSTQLTIQLIQELGDAIIYATEYETVHSNKSVAHSNVLQGETK